MNCLSRYLAAIALSVAAACLGAEAAACELCLVGTNTGHQQAVGGDDIEDALVAPDSTHGDATASFVIAGGSWPQLGGFGTPVNITYSFQNMFDGGLRMLNGQPLPNQLIKRSIEEALGLWAGVAPLNFVEVPDQGGPVFSGGDYPNGQFGQIRFRHVFINGPDIPDQPPVAKAQAYFPGSGSNLAGDVEFDDSDPWQEVGTLPVPDILGAATHEIGHTLGLHHTDDSSANMYWIFHRFAGPGTGQLFADDIAGIRAIYGAGMGSVRPLATPEPACSMLVAGALLIAAKLRWRSAA